MPKTLVADAKSQYATLRDETSGKDEFETNGLLAVADWEMRWESVPRGDADDGGGDVCAVDWCRLGCLRGCLKASRNGDRLIDLKVTPFFAC
jgi:hypothetical protein